MPLPSNVFELPNAEILYAPGPEAEAEVVQFMTREAERTIQHMMISAGVAGLGDLREGQLNESPLTALIWGAEMIAGAVAEQRPELDPSSPELRFATIADYCGPADSTPYPYSFDPDNERYAKTPLIDSLVAHAQDLAWASVFHARASIYAQCLREAGAKR